MAERQRCFELAVRCGTDIPEDKCPYFQTLAEESIYNSLEGPPTLFVVVAKQGTGKTLLARKLYERIIREKEDVVPVLLCGERSLLDKFEDRLAEKLADSLRRWVEVKRRKDMDPKSYGIRDLRQFAFLLNLSGLKAFLIFDELHFLAGDPTPRGVALAMGQLADRLRELEPHIPYAGFVFMTQDVDIQAAKNAIYGRGGSRWEFEVIPQDYLLPSGSVLTQIKEVMKRHFDDDEVAAAIYAKIAERHGFRAANAFYINYHRDRNNKYFGSIHDELTKYLSEKYKIRREVLRGSCRADIVVNDVAVDIKVCDDQQALYKSVEDDIRRGCRFRYLVIGRCPVKRDEIFHVVSCDVARISNAIPHVANAVNQRDEDVVKFVVETISEFVDLSGLGLEAKSTLFDKILPMTIELCREIGKEGKTRSDVLKMRVAKDIANMLGIQFLKAEDVTVLIQKIQQINPGLGIRLVGTYRVKCG